MTLEMKFFLWVLPTPCRRSCSQYITVAYNSYPDDSSIPWWFIKTTAAILEQFAHFRRLVKAPSSMFVTWSSLFPYLEANRVSLAKECWSVGQMSQQLLCVINCSWIFVPLLLFSYLQSWFPIYKHLLLHFFSLSFQSKFVSSKYKFNLYPITSVRGQFHISNQTKLGVHKNAGLWVKRHNDYFLL